jgi:hypothetical protein
MAPERASEPGTGWASVGVGTCPRSRFQAKAAAEPRYRKWAKWKAPPLTLGDCIEFLTFIEGRDVVVKAEDATDSERFEGTLGPPLPQSPDPHDQTSVTFPVHTSDSDPAARRVRLSADGFDTASYSSFDGVDYFTLRMSFDDNGIITVADANAPSI